MSLVIFDLDGTLIDSLADIADALNRTLQAHGLPPHPLAAYRHFVGEGVETLVGKAMAPRPFDPRVLQDYRQTYAGLETAQTRPYPGIAALLQALGDQGRVLAVLSNKPHPATERLVRHYFPQVPFADVHGQRPDVPKKPDPTAALAMAQRLAVRCEACFFVGDSAIDMQTACSAGMIAVGVTWGFRGREELAAAGAQHLVDTAEELARVLAVT